MSRRANTVGSNRVNADTADFSFIDILRKQCEPECAASLMKALRKTRVLDRLANEGYRQSPRERLDQFLALCANRLVEGTFLRIMLDAADLLANRGDLTTAEEKYAQVIGRAEIVGDRTLLAEACLRRSDVYCRQGYWKESSADLNTSRRLFHALNRVNDVARVDNMLGANLAEQGKMKQAQVHLKKALTAFSRTKEKTWEGTVLMNLGIVHNILGQHDAALLHYQRARSCFEQVGNLPKLAMLHHNIGMTYLHKSKLQESIKEFDDSFHMAAKSGDVGLIGLSRLGKAHVSYYLDDYPVSLRLVNQAISHFESSNDRLSIADAYKVKGMICRELGKFEAADLYFQTSLHINGELNNILNVGETSYELGVLERRRGRRELARKHLKHAHSCFSRIGAVNQVAQTEHQLNRCGKDTK